MNAFVLRIKPGGVDRVPEALESNELIIGWSNAEGLLDSDLEWNQFRQIVHEEYHDKDQDFKNSGRSAGNLWRFIREMNEGDLVLVPYGLEFYVAQVKGPANYNPSKISEDTAYRRSVEWLNDKKPIARKFTSAALRNKMNTRQSCVSASDLIPEIIKYTNIIVNKDIIKDIIPKSIEETEYLPTRKDIEEAYKKIVVIGKEIHIDDLFNKIEETYKLSGKKLKENWRKKTEDLLEMK